MESFSELVFLYIMVMHHRQIAIKMIFLSYFDIFLKLLYRLVWFSVKGLVSRKLVSEVADSIKHEVMNEWDFSSRKMGKRVHSNTGAWTTLAH